MKHVTTIVSSCQLCKIICQPMKFTRFRQYSKTCLKGPLKKNTKIVFQDRLRHNAGQKYCRMLPFAGQKYCRMLPLEHSAILLTLIKLPFVINILVLSIFEWLLKTGFTVYHRIHCLQFLLSNHKLSYILLVD